MPKPRKNPLIRCRYYTWRVCHRHGVLFADGRSNPTNVGRHSLGTRDRDEAMKALDQLDLTIAVRNGLAQPSCLQEQRVTAPGLDEGFAAYENSISGPRVAGGVGKATLKRYRAVREKFIPFARELGAQTWLDVNEELLRRYAVQLDKDGYAEATIYLELTTVKQVVKFLVTKKEKAPEDAGLPKSSLIQMRLEKPQSSFAYCYSRQEVKAILDVCRESPDLAWAEAALLTLACTGMRIGELCSLRWSDIDWDDNLIVLTNDPSVRKESREGRRQTKNRKNRSFPIHRELLILLRNLPRHSDELVLHGPLGGKRKADKLRIKLITRILPAAEEKLCQTGMSTEVRKGRLHSFRHFFCTLCVEGRIPEQTVMGWLGHQDSRMVRHYYHLKDEQSQAHMNRLDLTGSGPTTESGNCEPEN